MLQRTTEIKTRNTCWNPKVKLLSYRDIRILKFGLCFHISVAESNIAVNNDMFIIKVNEIEQNWMKDFVYGIILTTVAFCTSL
jgi:hypothetical protein